MLARCLSATSRDAVIMSLVCRADTRIWPLSCPHHGNGRSIYWPAALGHFLVLICARPAFPHRILVSRCD